MGSLFRPILLKKRHQTLIALVMVTLGLVALTAVTEQLNQAALMATRSQQALIVPRDQQAVMGPQGLTINPKRAVKVLRLTMKRQRMTNTKNRRTKAMKVLITTMTKTVMTKMKMK